MTKTYAILAAVVAVTALAAGLFAVLRPVSGDQFAQCRATAVAGGSGAIGGPFTLTNHLNERVTDLDVIDRPTLVYFGYTYCPDVCPLDTYRNAEAVALLAEQGVDVKPVMITIDPTRDTPEEMAAFVGYLHEDMVGLTGSSEEIKAVIKAYHVYAAQNGDGENYLMDHSTSTYLMAPEYGFLEFFRRETTPEQMAETVACFVERL